MILRLRQFPIAGLAESLTGTVFVVSLQRLLAAPPNGLLINDSPSGSGLNPVNVPRSANSVAASDHPSRPHGPRCRRR